ncbi:MAG: glycosyltransferase family 4 protein [Vicinamibacterales bacterium]
MTVVVTYFPSPYQVELFNEIERQRPGRLRVVYLFRQVANRRWAGVPATHQYSYLDKGAVPPSIEKDVEQAEFVVFNYYNDRRASRLIRRRAATARPWCFWGERPGYRFPWLARVARFRRLGALRSGDHPIWGIGSWAVDAYRKEFGPSRRYLNLPYYSDLDRFQASRPMYSDREFVFLFSGVLTRRKGVDLLAGAFRRLAAESPRVRLTIMGDGELAASMQNTLAGIDRVDWIGFKDWDALPAVYASAHTLCVPSRHDGWGLVVPEGLASSLPTIATDRTGAALDLIRPGHNGWVIPSGDEDALLHAMRDAAALDAVEWRAMSERARDSVRSHSLAAGATRFLEAVETAVHQAEVAI